MIKSCSWGRGLRANRVVVVVVVVVVIFESSGERKQRAIVMGK